MSDPIKVDPHRDSATGTVYHVKVQLVFEGVVRYQVFLRKPEKRLVSFKNCFRGLEKFNEEFYGERGERIGPDNGINLRKYRSEIGNRVWAIIREGEKKMESCV